MLIIKRNTNIPTPRLWLALVLFILHGIPAANAEVTLKEMRSASDDVLVAFFTGDSVDVNEIGTGEASQWSINGNPAIEIHEYATQADFCDYHVYLKTSKLEEGKTYRFKGLGAEAGHYGIWSRNIGVADQGRSDSASH